MCLPKTKSARVHTTNWGGRREAKSVAHDFFASSRLMISKMRIQAEQWPAAGVFPAVS